MFLKRRGWSEAANTWEPVENLVQCSDIIDAFEERFSFYSFLTYVLSIYCKYVCESVDKYVDFVVFQS